MPWWKERLADAGVTGSWAVGTALVTVLLLALLVHFTVGRALLSMLQRVAKRTRSGWDDELFSHRVFHRLLRLLPCWLVYVGVEALDGLHPVLELVLVRGTAITALFIATRALTAFLDACNGMYQQRPEAAARPVKGYVQVVQLVLWAGAVIVGVATAADKSPLLFLSGLGAMTAVLLLVFKDTLLGLVASVQLASNDMVRVGDWIEMPSNHADGAVVDIALHTVKVRNWDNTITTVPTWSLIAGGFKNWRAMFESGGRRIKRALIIEHASIRHLSDEEIVQLRGVSLLTGYLDEKKRVLAELNTAVPGEAKGVVTNLRRLTNIGTFRAYIQAWLDAHPLVHRNMFCMVRQLPPTAEGLPIEIYCFTTTVKWVEYEGIQSDIFDHVLAVAGEFGLRVYQAPSAADLRSLRPTARGE